MSRTVSTNFETLEDLISNQLNRFYTVEVITIFSLI